LNASVRKVDNTNEYGSLSSTRHIERSRREIFKSLLSTTATLAVPNPATAWFFKKPSLVTPPANEPVLGPLNNLIGKWEGNQGFVLIAVPSPGSIPSNDGAFTLLMFPYRERLEIESIGPEGASNKGGSIDQVNGVCTYTKTVWATDQWPDDPDKQKVIHKENGMFFYLNAVTTNPGSNPVDPKDKPPFSIGRSAIIPHGNTAMIFGGVTEYKGAPKVPDIATLPFTTPATNFTLFGYTDAYNVPPFPSARPMVTLQSALDNGPPIDNTVHFSLDSKNGGGVLNTNFITKRSDAREYVG